MVDELWTWFDPESTVELRANNQSPIGSEGRLVREDDDTSSILQSLSIDT